MSGDGMGFERQDAMEEIKQGGLAGVLVRLWSNRRLAKAGQERQMELLEVLPLGKRQLMLVRCGKECFLVGGGLDNIGSIMKIEPRQQDELCG